MTGSVLPIRKEIAVRDASQDFEDFIYLLSHDVRNSTRALIEVPSWVREDIEEAGYPLTESLDEDLGLLETHSRRLDRMLSDLLIYSRIGTRQQFASIRIEDALDMALEDIEIPKDIRLERNIGYPLAHIGERDAVTLMAALISNSIKHRDRETSRIEIATRLEGGKCLITVFDDGPGIPENHRERVFEAMTTLRPRDEVEGSGMGLAFVRKIVRVCNGSAHWGDTGGVRGLRLDIKLPV